MTQCCLYCSWGFIKKAGGNQSLEIITVCVYDMVLHRMNCCSVNFSAYLLFLTNFTFNWMIYRMTEFLFTKILLPPYIFNNLIIALINN
ncbi:hypothetical protein E1A91_D13G182000v1 [Gossypium mustelinum]|uniref:Uncharacterized protein n=1 Tax=Gossypium mustelinum TaxID=34275 RepID=A0A5D2S523_GOSMU|nr:hypothetical protein E1A91_D13G182000v1 [Gossypium mustelinum]